MNSFGTFVAVAGITFGLTSCGKPPMPVQRMVYGKVLRADSHSVTVISAADGSRTASGRTFMISNGQTTVLVRQPVPSQAAGEIRWGEVQAGVSALRPGAVVKLSARDDIALTITVLPPVPLRAEVSSVSGDLLRLRPAGRNGELGPERAFHVHRENCIVMAERLGENRYRLGRLDDLKRGDFVAIEAVDGSPRTIQLTSAPPIVGKLRSIDAQSVTILPAAHRGEAPAKEHTFHISAQTKLLTWYFGVMTEPARLSDFSAGLSVEVKARDEVATSLTIVRSPIHGRLVSAGDGSITIQPPSGPAAPAKPAQTVAVNPSTRVLVARVLSTVTAPNGKHLHSFDYTSGHTLAELRTGDELSVTVKGNVALEIRVQPRIEIARG